MDYCRLANIYESVGRVSSKLEKTRILAEFFREIPPHDLEKVVLLAQGRVFPRVSSYELGIASRMMIKAISKFTGFPSGEIEDRLREKGDLGLVAEEYAEKKKQAASSAGRLTVGRVFEDLRKLAFISGADSQDRKFVLIGSLLASAKPKEARYIVKTILGELRVGVAEGIIRDAIVEAFLLRRGIGDGRGGWA